ncbi:MAG: DUF1553 domain-containing protein [Verrucomicrobiaceae bacterium]|nr:DUF1553 domain-containing protein [Verrucomicrobiaceae bacterium]
MPDEAGRSAGPMIFWGWLAFSLRNWDVGAEFQLLFMMNRLSALPWLSSVLLLGVLAAGASWAVNAYLKPPVAVPGLAVGAGDESVTGAVRALDDCFRKEWLAHGLTPTVRADDLTVLRRLSLALTGSLPSLQELREFDAARPADAAGWWAGVLLKDRRTSDYLAERLARVYVGTETGPFLIYRRRRLVEWLSDALLKNRRYDEVVRSLITASGVWTTAPEVNFISVTNENKKGPDEEKLAAKVSRAFLGVRIDCVQCHDGKLGSTWTQKDFHSLAAWFGQADFAFTGLRDNGKMSYKHRFLGQAEVVVVPPGVPWRAELLPAKGGPRERLAAWITAKENGPFARAMVNRVWALLFNRPLVSPVDDMPVDGPFPEALEVLSEDFKAHDYDLHRLIRVITSAEVFRLGSASGDGAHPVTVEAEKHWAAFPVTRLRPEQMAGSVVQAASLTTIDAETHVIFRIRRDIEVANFVKRYGDAGEDSFEDGGGTIPQRLLLMNGNLTTEHTKNNPVLNASSRIAMLAPDDRAAVEAAYLSILTRRPSPEEEKHFLGLLAEGKNQKSRANVMADICWTLLNATEFSWNH